MTVPGQFSALLIHTCVVLRRQEVGGEQKLDRFRQPTRDEEPIASFPCRITSATGGEVMQERSRDVISANHEIFADRGADVREDDVVTVLGEGGVPIIERAQVTLVRRPYDGVQEHHVEIKVNTQRGPQ